MKTLRKILLGGLAVAALLSSGCSKPAVPNQPEPKFTNELSPYTRILSEEELKRISSFSQTQVAFSQPVSYPVGTIIQGGISDKTPDGFLRKVSKISIDKKTVYTEQATLEDALKRAVFEFEISPPSRLYELETEQGVTQEFHKSSSLNIDFHFKNVLLFDLDKNLSTKDDQITLNGGLKLHSNSFLKCEIGKNLENILDELSFRNKTDVKTELELKSPLSLGNIKEEKRIARYKFPSFIVGFIPGTPIPLIVKPQLDVYVGIKGSICQIETSVNQDSSFDAGIFYKQGKWTEKSGFSASFDFSPPNIPSVLKFEAYANPKLSFLVYGFVGPYGEAGAYLELDAGQSSWKLIGGLKANLGVNASVFSKNLESYYLTIADYSRILAEGKMNKEAQKPRTLENSVAGKEDNEKMLILSSSPFIKGHDEGYDIFIINPDGSGRKNLTNKPSDIFSPSFSPDGKEIIFGESDWMHIIGSDGSEKGYIEDTGPVYNASYSPNRKKIIFASKLYKDLEIRVIDLETSEITKLTEGNHPSFSPDGRKIIFDSYRNRAGGIYVMNADGSNIQHLTVGLNDSSPRWSPDGEKIVFCSEKDGNSEIYVMNADRSNQRRLTNNLAEDIFPCWSPDGKRIAFSSSRDSKKYIDYEIYVMNEDGSNQTNISNNKDEFDIVFDWKDFTGKTTGKSQPQVSQASRLEDYFFQGKELEGLKFTGIKDSTGEPFLNPHISTEREIANFQQQSGLSMDKVLRAGFALYSLPGEKKEEYPPGMWVRTSPDDYSLDEGVRLAQLIFEFYKERDNWEFLREFEGFKKGDTSLAFVNKNISSVIMVDEDTLELEKILVGSLEKYAKRIGGEFYPLDDSWGIDYYTNEIYGKLGIPVKESAKYLGEAFEFQKRIYDVPGSDNILDEEKLENLFNNDINNVLSNDAFKGILNIFYKELGFNSVRGEINKYRNKEIGRDELEKKFLRFGKEAGKKLFYTFPNMGRIFHYPLIKEATFVMGGYYDDDFRKNIIDAIEEDGDNWSDYFK